MAAGEKRIFAHNWSLRAPPTSDASSTLGERAGLKHGGLGKRMLHTMHLPSISSGTSFGALGAVRTRGTLLARETHKP